MNKPEPSPVTLIQLTDPHLFGDNSGELMGINTRQSFIQTVTMMAEQEPHIDQILVTGDISQDDSLESYLFCKKVLAGVNTQVAWLCGNHDQASILEADQLRGLFPKQISLGDWQILLLNTPVQNQAHGALTPEELSFLESALASSPDTPTLVAMHHHPLPIDSPWMDEIPMKNGPELMVLLSHYPQVKTLLHGHVHQFRESDSHGVRILATPSTSVQFAPGAQDFEVDTCQPGYRKIILYPGGHFETNVYRLPEGSWMPDLSQPGY